MITEHILEHQRKHHCKWGKSDYKELLHKNHQSIAVNYNCYAFSLVWYHLVSPQQQHHDIRVNSFHYHHYKNKKNQKNKKGNFQKSSQEPVGRASVLETNEVGIDEPRSGEINILCDIRV